MRQTAEESPEGMYEENDHETDSYVRTESQRHNRGRHELIINKKCLGVFTSLKKATRRKCLITFQNTLESVDII